MKDGVRRLSVGPLTYDSEQHTTVMPLKEKVYRRLGQQACKELSSRWMIPFPRAI